MGETYVLGDLMQTLIRLEEKGHDMYSALVEKQTSLEAKKLFTILANQELKHKKLYEKMRSELEEVNALEEEYKSYVDILLKDTISFLKGSVEPQNTELAFETAVRLEKDTLLLLSELQQIVPPSAHKLIEQVQEEERKHLQWIIQYRDSIV